MSREFPKNSSSNSYEMVLEDAEPFYPPMPSKDTKGMIDLENSIRAFISTNISSEMQTEEQNTSQLILSSHVEQKDGEIHLVTVVCVGNQVFKVLNRLQLQNQLQVKATTNNPLTLLNLCSLPDVSNRRRRSVGKTNQILNATAAAAVASGTATSTAGTNANDDHIYSRKTSDTSIQSDATQQLGDSTSRLSCSRCGSTEFTCVQKELEECEEELDLASEVKVQSKVSGSSQKKSKQAKQSNSEIPSMNLNTPSVSAFMMESPLSHGVISLKDRQSTIEVTSDDDCDENDSEMFTNEKIARTEKKNVVKNFMKAFISDVRKNPTALVDSIDENSGSGSSNSNISLQKRQKKFEAFMKKGKYNHLFMKQLLNHAEYGNVFASFLLGPAEEWLANSQVKNKETHKQMLSFFQKSIEDSTELDKLKVLKRNKRKGIFSSTNISSNYRPPSIASLLSLQHIDDIK